MTGLFAPMVLDGPITPDWIEAVGATLRFLPPYSPDINPIEYALAWLEAMLGTAAERTVRGLRELIGRLVDISQSAQSINYFRSCGYDPE